MIMMIMMIIMMIMMMMMKMMMMKMMIMMIKGSEEGTGRGGKSWEKERDKEIRAICSYDKNCI